jgi:hypothetical protein
MEYPGKRAPLPVVALPALDRVPEQGRLARTRTALALALSAAYNAPIEETRFGVFRM